MMPFAEEENNEIYTGEDYYHGDDEDIMVMSGSHPAPAYDEPIAQYDVDLGNEEEDDSHEVGPSEVS